MVIQSLVCRPERRGFTELVAVDAVNKGHKLPPAPMFLFFVGISLKKAIGRSVHSRRSHHVGQINPERINKAGSNLKKKIDEFRIVNHESAIAGVLNYR